MNLKSEELLSLIVSAAEDKKAQDLVILDMREISLMTDYFVIASADTTVQIRAIYRAIEDALENVELPVKRRNGSAESRWILLDYGTIVVHLFHHAEREYYDLERLWGDAKKLYPQDLKVR